MVVLIEPGRGRRARGSDARLAKDVEEHEYAVARSAMPLHR